MVRLAVLASGFAMLLVGCGTSREDKVAALLGKRVNPCFTNGLNESSSVSYGCVTPDGKTSVIAFEERGDIVELRFINQEDEWIETRFYTRDGHLERVDKRGEP